MAAQSEKPAAPAEATETSSEPLVGAPSADGEPAPAAEPDPVVGQLLGGRYRVLERLAAGGMGTVYRAEHVGLRKEVALKLVNEEAGARPDHALRFLREAMLTSRIEHPNVISATDYGTFEDGTAFLAMSLVSGPTLASVMVVERPMRWPRAAEIGAQIADAIAAAQSQGIVHRDLKPENLVLQSMPDGTEVVKVLDFGIAKYARDSLAPPAAQPVQNATRVGLVVGTPGYMAPEQAVGKRADHRSDLYALGVLLWECVVGRKLWAFEDIQQLMAAQLNQAPPSVRRASGDPSIPDAFDSLVASLLAIRPELRPQSASDARDILRAIALSARGAAALEGSAPALPPNRRDLPTVVIERPGPPQRTGATEPAVQAAPAASTIEPNAPAQTTTTLPEADEVVTLPKHKLAGKLGLAALALLLVAATVALWPRPRTAEPESPSAKRAAAESEHEPAAVKAAPPPASAEVVASAPIAPPIEQASDPPQPSAASAATRIVARSAPAATAKTGAASGANAETLRASARKAFARKDFRNAARLYEQATGQAPNHAGAHAGLGASRLALGDAKAAIVSYRRAIELSPGSSGFHAALGRAYLVSGDRQRAIASYRKAVALDPTNQAAFAALAQLAP
jgi:serine/threonine-protein kinase